MLLSPSKHLQGLSKDPTGPISTILNTDAVDWQAASGAWLDLRLEMTGTMLAGAVQFLGDSILNRDLEACRTIVAGIKDTIAFWRRYRG